MNSQLSKLAIICCAAFTITATGCMEDTPRASQTGAGKVGGSPVLEQLVIDNIANNVIMASYRDLRDRTQELATLAAQLRQNPTQANLDAIQAKWKEARIPWESTEGFLFGPVVGLGVDPAIDSWPLSKIDLDKILETRPNIDAAFVRGLGTDVQGFHTAEYLMFGDGVESNNKSIQQMTTAQLAYLEAVTAVLAENTDMLFKSWTEHHDPSDMNTKPYLDLVRKPGFDNIIYTSNTKVFYEFTQGMIKIAVEVGKGKLSDPLGGNIDAADPSQVESQFSWNSLVDFSHNIESMENVYTGHYNGRDGAGLEEIVKLANPKLNEKILKQIAEAKQAVLDIGGTEGMSYTKAIKDPQGRARAQIAIDSIATLELTLQDELLPMFQ